MTKHPLLLLVFNRYRETMQVFEAIRKAQPSKLYIASDGPRPGVSGEKQTVEVIRNHVIGRIDWPCDVKTRFLDANLGCRNAVSSAIDWLFEHEDAGVILEDDCVPKQSFFDYADEMLDRFRFDERVGMIVGTNLYPVKSQRTLTQAFFSKHYPVWGWATWKRAWDGYDVNMKSYDKLRFRDIRYQSPNLVIAMHMKQKFDRIKKDWMDTWDIQWVFHCWKNSRLAVAPSFNMVTNIGEQGVHTPGRKRSDHHRESLDIASGSSWEMSVPYTVPDSEYDMRIFRRRVYFSVLKTMARRMWVTIVGVFGAYRK